MSERGTVTGLPVNQPIIQQLPAIYQDGMFLRAFTSGLDEDREAYDVRHALGGVAGHAGVFGTAGDVARFPALALGGTRRVDGQGKQVAVEGTIGLVTPLGIGVDAFWSGLTAGKSGLIAGGTEWIDVPFP